VSNEREKLSDSQIKYVISAIESAQSVATREGWRGQAKIDRIKELTEDFLVGNSGGVWEDVCGECLGTGSKVRK